MTNINNKILNITIMKKINTIHIRAVFFNIYSQKH